MRCGERWSALRQIASDQFGVFTAHQARAHTVPSYELTRMVADGQLWRVRHGVYAFIDDLANKHPYEDWAAQWLALCPDTEIGRRRTDPDVVISHQSAAEILDLGTIVSHGLLHLSGPRRIRVRAANVHTHQCPVGTQGVDWELAEGLPVSTAARVIDDLTAAAVDGSHLGIAITDALERGLASAADLNARLDRHARAWGSASGNELAQRLMRSADHL
ncbi:type IV toxin-antitoxin system AbiEi family antitoxin domain-containing protein [Mycobacteroides chelonae]|uniref:type IV toxin-antitoxin system AbiEi family antitoxin domain-containing protein n=1 Tax=Mycobacteroides chelonae TaxID=1774 RepID=UPI001C2BC611|nr:type IV toxin-antitoxin system AbiEi family antitoxin domain-containing protein [Mycobacteroides chelonae]MBV0917972.1 type IV toxin-antitoxin system AbiEi family antitoxin domain-containing protein [Mycobacteroides chelonae]